MEYLWGHIPKEKELYFMLKYKLRIGISITFDSRIRAMKYLKVKAKSYSLVLFGHIISI